MTTYSSIPSFMQATNQCNSPPSSSTSHGQARIAYFITRNNGLPVPLIPADELPFSVKLQNVPRVLTPDQTYGLHYVGGAPYTGVTFKEDREVTFSSAPTMQRSTSQPPGGEAGGGHIRSQSGNITTKQFLAPDALARQAFAHNAQISSTTGTVKPSLGPTRPLSVAETAKSWRRSDPVPGTSDATQSVIDAILNSTSGAETADRIGYNRTRNPPPPPSGIIPDQEKKEYCTHWILQGWCAYEQQGCRYKHEMLDKEGLAKIGIRHVPRWWQERNSLIKLGGLGLTGGSGSSGERVAPVIVGTLKRPEEWMKSRKGSDADSESSTTSEEEESGSEEVNVSSEDEKEMEKKRHNEKTFAARKAAAEEVEAAKKAEAVANKAPICKAPRAPTNEDEKARQQSIASDLINFEPLLPTPSSSTSSSEVAISSTPKRIQNERALPANKSGVSPPAKTTKVFIPAGESPEKHIADAKKRERVARSRNPSPTKTIKSASHVSSPDKENHDPHKVKATGLGASRWATLGTGSGEREKEVAKVVRQGCRPRRPASSSPKILSSRAVSVEKK